MRSHLIVMDDWRTRYRADQLQGRLGVNSWRGGFALATQKSAIRAYTSPWGWTDETSRR